MNVVRFVQNKRNNHISKEKEMITIREVYNIIKLQMNWNNRFQHDEKLNKAPPIPHRILKNQLKNTNSKGTNNHQLNGKD